VYAIVFIKIQENFHEIGNKKKKNPRELHREKAIRKKKSYGFKS
jgi:hypothetical protein